MANNRALGFSYLTENGRLILNTIYGGLDISQFVEVVDAPSENSKTALISVDVLATIVNDENI